jgi:hypothetical protein
MKRGLCCVILSIPLSSLIRLPYTKIFSISIYFEMFTTYLKSVQYARQIY